MKLEIQAALTVLTQDDIARVAGGSIQPVITEVLQAQDMYGNTMSIEEWMDRQIDVANSNGTLDPHDFYDPGFDSNKPNIWR